MAMILFEQYYRRVLMVVNVVSNLRRIFLYAHEYDWYSIRRHRQIYFVAVIH